MSTLWYTFFMDTDTEPLTPEQRAAAITAEWTAIVVRGSPVDSRFCPDQVTVGGDMVAAVREQIADAIRAAVAVERRVIAKMADAEQENLGETGDDVLTRLAAAIRERVTP